MKASKRFKVVSYLWMAVILISLSTIAGAAETYKVDTAHTYVIFRVKHFETGFSYGNIFRPSGSFSVDESSALSNPIEMKVEAKNINTGIEKRDKHLKSADFFDADKHPLISFKSTSVKKTADKTYEITGDLTLLGETRPITAKAIEVGAGKDPYGKYRRGYETSFTIKRSEFGMGKMTNAASDEIQLTVSIEGIKQ